MNTIIKSFIVVSSIAYSLQAMDENVRKRKLDAKGQVNKYNKQTPSSIILPNYDDFSDTDLDLTEVMKAPLTMISTIEPHDNIDENIEKFIETSSENKVEITSSLAETFICCCGNFESTLDKLQIHVKQVHGRQCPSCNYNAQTPYDLFRHIFTHTGENPYKCDYEGCNFATNKSGYLKVHKLIHTGEKPFKCNYEDCDFATISSSNLKRHKLTHAGAKLYKCDFENCSYAATTSSNLKRHKKKHIKNEK